MTTGTSPKAVLVAGGKGTRIRSLTGDLIPKALVPVAGKPIAHRLLGLLARYGVREVAVLAGHLAEQLTRALPPEAERLGITLHFFIEDAPLGTAGGLLAARELLADDDFLVLYADMAVEMDLTRFIEFHRRHKGAASIAAHPNDHPQTSDLLSADASGRIQAFHFRNSRPDGWYRNLVPAAVYCLSPAVFDFIAPLVPQDFIKDVFPRLLEKNRPVYAYNTPEYLRDMGTPERYDMVECDIRSGLLERMNFAHRRPAVFFDRDGVLNTDIAGTGIVRRDQFELLPHAAEAVRKVNDAGWLAVLVTNQPQLAKGFLSFEDLDRIHAMLETLLGRHGAKLDRIYFCPHHPERGFDGEVRELKIECACRKPAPGMILDAARDLPILLEGSCLIGDSYRDMGAARAAGIRAYGVRTGSGCRDCVDNAMPDRLFDNVLEAVSFALQRTL